MVSVIGWGYSLLFNVLNKHFTGSLFPTIVHFVVNAAFSYCWNTATDMLCHACKLQNHRVLGVKKGWGVNLPTAHNTPTRHLLYRILNDMIITLLSKLLLTSDYIILMWAFCKSTKNMTMSLTPPITLQRVCPLTKIESTLILINLKFDSWLSNTPFHRG